MKVQDVGTANGNRTRILALKGLRANRCTIAALLVYFSINPARYRCAAELLAERNTIAKLQRATSFSSGPRAASAPLRSPRKIPARGSPRTGNPAQRHAPSSAP